MRGSREVLVLQEYIPSYRVAFFQGLRKELKARGFLLSIAVGRAGRMQELRNDKGALDADHRLRSLEMRWGRRRLVFRVPPPGFLRSDVVVLEHSVKHIDHILILVSRRLLGRPSVLWGHGHTITEPQPALQRVLQKLQIRLASGYLAYTPGSAARAIRGGAQPERVATLMNTVPEYSVPVPIPKAESSHWNALYIGGLDASKKIDELFTIAQKVHTARPQFRLIIAGDGEMRPSVEKRCREEWLTYLGRVDEHAKGALATHVQVLLNPGRVGLIAVDSFRLAAPIVTLQDPFHAPEFEYIAPANSAVCIDVDDAAARLVELIDSPGLLRAMQRAALDRAETLTLDNMIRRFADGVQSAASRSGAR